MVKIKAFEIILIDSITRFQTLFISDFCIRSMFLQRWLFVELAQRFLFVCLFMLPPIIDLLLLRTTEHLKICALPLPTISTIFLRCFQLNSVSWTYFHIAGLWRKYHTRNFLYRLVFWFEYSRHNICLQSSIAVCFQNCTPQFRVAKQRDLGKIGA